MNIDLRLGDCLEVLKTIPDNSVDAVVTDPPYHLTSIVKRFGKEDSAPAQFGTDGAYSRASKGFMGKEWDGGDIAFRTDVWEECLRILKPGGHLLAFSHSRTYHRMGVAIEDAGFEIRDQIMWVYGSGFPKSHNIGKAIDKRGGNNHLTQEIGDKLKEARESRNITKTQADELFCNGTTNYMWFEGRSDGIRLPDDVSFEKICNEWEELKPYQDLIKSANREVIGQYDGDMGGLGGERLGQSNGDITIASTEQAKNWEGWGTALKPAHEPIVMARKPLSEKSIAENVLKHGTGGINIDGSRIEFEDTQNAATNPKFRKENNYKMPEPGQESNGAVSFTSSKNEYDTSGRFPANIIFDEEAGQLLDEQSGPTSQGHWAKTKTTGFGEFGNGKSEYKGVGPKDKNKEKGGASRFFYCPKSAKKDRNEGLDHLEDKKRPGQSNTGLYSSSPVCVDCGLTVNGTNDHSNCEEGLEYKPSTTTTKNNHPTVKPTDLMRYLINLVTPPNGTILDPFMGSGSTGKAAVRCGVNFIGIEKEQEYMDIASARIEHERNKPTQTKLF
jgi:DNA modification methylase